jgi:hypothetical protein
MGVGVIRIHKCIPTITQQPQNQTVSLGGTTSLTFVTGTNSTYQWEINQGNGFISLNNDNVYSGTNSSVMTINNAPANIINYSFRCVANSTSICKQISDTATIATSSTSIEETEHNNDLLLYPNPVSNILKIESPIKIKKIEIVNLIGEITNMEYKNRQIEMKGLPSGTYILKITTEQGELYRKINKE